MIEKRLDAASVSPRRGRISRLGALFILVVIVAAAAAGALYWWARPSADDGQGVAARGHESGHAAHGTYYTCGMHPWVVLPSPGLCPICHMELTPLDPSKLTGEIAIDPVIVQNVGVRIAPVVEGPLSRQIRTFGSVAFDETTLRVCNAKVGGWIEDLLVDSEGEHVAMGQPIFVIYSPELYAAQEEYLLAYRNRDASPGLLVSARTRLRYLDVTDEHIAELERSDEPQRTMTMHSPHEGVVIEKAISEGARVEAGAPVYRVADLSRVWVNVAVYEYQAPFIRAGQTATMTLPFLPGRSFEGEVAYIYPYLDEASRQLRVRLEFSNDEGVLKPGMLANVELRGVVDETATIAPREAVVRTGSREVVFVSLGGGRFEPRTVRTGVETADGRVQVLEGLTPGEQVVTSGQFLLDSESKMRIALAKMVEGELASEARPLITATQRRGAEVGPEGQAAVDRAVQAYLTVQTRLAGDTMDGVVEAWAGLQDAGVAMSSEAALAQQGAALAAATESRPADLEQAREAFKAISAAVIEAAEVAPPGYTREAPLFRAHCPMVKADWLQATRTLANPYMGPRMLACGTIEGVITAGREGASEQEGADPAAGHAH